MISFAKTTALRWITCGLLTLLFLVLAGVSTYNFLTRDRRLKTWDFQLGTAQQMKIEAWCVRSVFYDFQVRVLDEGRGEFQRMTWADGFDIQWDCDQVLASISSVYVDMDNEIIRFHLKQSRQKQSRIRDFPLVLGYKWQAERVSSWEPCLRAGKEKIRTTPRTQWSTYEDE